MRGFSSYLVIIAMMIFAVIISYLVVLSSLSYEKKDKIRVIELERLIEEQSRIVNLGKNVVVYCGESTGFSFNTSLNYSKCSVSYGNIKSKNCMLDIVEISNSYVKDKNITNETLDQHRIALENLLETNGYNCTSSLKNTGRCGEGFEIICNAGKIETKNSFEEELVYIRGGIG